MTQPNVNNIFNYGIVWHPNEPLPEDVAQNLSPPPKISALQKVAGETSGRKGSLHHPPVHIPATLNQPIGAGSKEANPTPKKALLKPLHASVTGQVIQDSAQLNISQSFQTRTDSPVTKGLFTFPLPNGCVVTGFTCRVGTSKILKANIKPRDQAAKAFEKAVGENRTAALLQQNSPDVFTASIGNIAADTKVRTEIKYLVSLKTRVVSPGSSAAAELTIPTDIGPRYGASSPDAIGPTLEARSIDLDLQLLDAEGTHIECHTHDITVDDSRGHAIAPDLGDLVELTDAEERHDSHTARIILRQGSTFRDRDFVLQFHKEPQVHKESPRALAWLEAHPTLENQMALMVDIPQSLLMKPKTPANYGEVIFLADRSGSMTDHMVALRSALQFFFKGIPLGRTFNLWSFGSTCESLWPSSRDYGKSALKEALEYLKHGFEANMGGTEILSAVKAAVESRNSERKLCDIIILTDGQVWRLEEMLSYVAQIRKESLGAVRFFSLGIGSHVSSALVEGIATHGGGYSEIIQGAESGGWEDRVVSMLRAALNKRIGHVSLDLGDGHVPNGLLQSPRSTSLINTFQDYNPFQRPRLYSLFESNSRTLPREITLRINGKDPGNPEESYTLPVMATKSPPGLIHGLAVRAILGDIDLSTETNPHIEAATHDDLNSKPHIITAEGLACKFSLLSKWTSFFLEESDPKQMDSDPFIGICCQAPQNNIVTGGTLYAARDFTMRNGPRHLVRGSSMCSSSASCSSLENVTEFSCKRAAMPTPRFSQYSMSVLGAKRIRYGLPSVECQSTGVPTPASAAESPIVISKKSHLMDGFSRIRSKLSALGRFFPSSDEKASGKGAESYSSWNTVHSIYDMDSASTDLSTTTLPERSPPRPDESARRLTARILAHQNFDGSFRDAVMQDLGPKFANPTEKLMHLVTSHVSSHETPGWAHKVALATVTLTILRRDLADASEFWSLMEAKILTYIESVVADTCVNLEWLESEAAVVMKDVQLEVDPGTVAPGLSKRIELDTAPL